MSEDFEIKGLPKGRLKQAEHHRLIFSLGRGSHDCVANLQRAASEAYSAPPLYLGRL